jgi:hypothetical protein
MKMDFSRQIFDKPSNVKFNPNPSIGNRVVPAGRKPIMTKLTVAFCSFANAPKNYNEKRIKVYSCCMGVGLILLILAVFQMFIT